MVLYVHVGSLHTTQQCHSGAPFASRNSWIMGGHIGAVREAVVWDTYILDQSAWDGVPPLLSIQLSANVFSRKQE